MLTDINGKLTFHLGVRPQKCCIIFMAELVAGSGIPRSPQSHEICINKLPKNPAPTLNLRDANVSPMLIMLIIVLRFLEPHFEAEYLIAISLISPDFPTIFPPMPRWVWKGTPEIIIKRCILAALLSI